MKGKSIGQYLERESDRTVFAERLKTPRSMQVSMYGRHLDLVVIPVYNLKGEYLGPYDAME